MTNETLQGLIVINKPPGITSSRVVERIKSSISVRKAGHTGTLDPFATGVLPVCINECTKLAPFIMEGEKEYEGVLHLGIETDTQDVTGKIISHKEPVHVTEEEIMEALQKFRGKIMQIPPLYSAVKYKGRPLYRWARQGKEIERNAREVEIRELSLRHLELPLVFFRVVCSKGTYIRALVSAIGNDLGCGAFLEGLKRTRSGEFSLDDSITLAELGNVSLEEIRTKWLISPSKALSSFPTVKVNDEISRKVVHGNLITHSDLRDKVTLPSGLKGKVRILNPQGKIIAVAEMGESIETDGETHWGKPAWRLLRVFNFKI